MSFARRLRDDFGDTYTLGFARVIGSLLLFWQALESGRELLSRGYFGAVFHMPFVPEALVPRGSVFAMLLAARLVVAILATVGVRARPSLAIASLLGFYALACDRVHYSDGAYALYCTAFILALSPCDRAWLISAPAIPTPRTGQLWTASLLRIFASIIVLASAISKLADADYCSGFVLDFQIAALVREGLPARAAAFFVEHTSHAPGAFGIGKIFVALELFVGVALWPQKTRVLALFAGVWLVLLIELTTFDHLLAFVLLVLFVGFVTPDAHARKLYFDPSRPKGAVLARLVLSLDWLGRFDVLPWAPDGQRGHTIVVVRRDGSRATGIRAFAMVARCVPLLFPLWGLIAFAATFTKGGEASSRV